MKFIATICFLLSAVIADANVIASNDKSINNKLVYGEKEISGKKEGGFAGFFGQTVVQVEQEIPPIDQQTSQAELIQNGTEEMFSCQTPNLSCFYPSKTTSQRFNYESDQKVCDCLNSRFGVRFAELGTLSKKELEERDRKVAEGKLLAALWDLKRNFIRNRDAVLVEAHLLNNKARFDLLAQVSITKETIDGLKEAIRENYKEKVSSKFMDDAFKMIDNFAIENGKSDTVLSSFNRAFTHNESCVPLSQYLKVSMIPDSPKFWEDLLRNESFPSDPDSWNYYQILSQHNSGVDKETNRAKLDFLNRNPALKSIFYLGSLEEKKLAYQKLREALKPSKDCIKANSCRGQFFRNGGNLQESLKDLYNSPNAITVLATETYSQGLTDVSGVAMAPYLAPSLQAIRFGHSKPGLNYSQCNGDTDPKLIPQCSDFFENYCADIRDGRHDLQRTISAEENSTEYGKRWMEDLESDPRNNRGYIEYQDKMCNRLARTYPGSKEKINFHKFKKDYCGKNAQECWGKSNVDIFKTFMANTESTGDVFTVDGQIERNEEMHILALAGVNSTTPPISSQQINDIRNSNSLQSLANGQSRITANSIDDLLEQIPTNFGSGTTQGNPTSQMEAFAERSLFVGSSDSSEGSLFDAGSDSIINQSGNLNSGYYHSANDSIASQDSNDSSINEARNELNRLKKDEQAIKNEIGQVESNMRSRRGGDSQALAMRLENLEKLLAEKEQASKGYQDLISKLIDQRSKPSETTAAVEAPAAEEAKTTKKKTTKKVAASSTSASNRPTISEETNQQRGPANVESFSTSSSAMGGGSIGGSFASGSRAASSGRKGVINGALLSKYGIIVKDNPGSPVNVAAEADSSRFQAISGFREATNIPLEVSQKAFEKFKSNDLSALQELYKESIQNTEQDIVKIMISSEDTNETLEFYAIKEDGKVLFQPLRKNKLSDLRNTLSQ